MRQQINIYQLSKGNKLNAMKDLKRHQIRHTQSIVGTAVTRWSQFTSMWLAPKPNTCAYATHAYRSREILHRGWNKS